MSEIKTVSVSFWKQPLFHFLIAGAAIFLFSFWRGDKPQPRNDHIVVSVSDVQRLASLWQQTWKREPTELELQALVRDHIKEEVYYREALTLGLDINDTIIRRRLRQKMEFLSTGKVELIEPEQGELEQYFTDHQNNYKPSAQYDFKQIYFAPKTSYIIDLCKGF